MRGSHARLQRETSSLSSRHDNEATREKNECRCIKKHRLSRTYTVKKIICGYLCSYNIKKITLIYYETSFGHNYCIYYNIMNIFILQELIFFDNLNINSINRFRDLRNLFKIRRFLIYYIKYLFIIMQVKIVAVHCTFNICLYISFQFKCRICVETLQCKQA